MTKTKIANLISDGLNPPAAGLIILGLVASEAAGSAVEALKWFIAVTGLCFMPPLLIAVYLVRTGRMDALFSNRRHQRHRIYVVGLFFNVLGTFILTWLNAPQLLTAALIAGLASIVSFAFINLWWKISVHASTVAALVTVLHILYGAWAVPSLSLIPLMGWARVHLGQHTAAQVAVGSALSSLIVLIVFTRYGGI
ncbi:hypothetical protein DEALK_15750 [Dehalogenimonas alkenigignens]|uniref:PAP2 superfamily n=1 Tax=Dehalogenimonas alkenigignens TaxID=1217799 RepID=A0A0W0GJM0_9CHLR|nr:hypothetical protein [Dehalogenimonas alkenigignens]KTB48728.1 hypothetical protein DEALK_15750 [Dehalogenimonas alkenigignens]